MLLLVLVLVVIVSVSASVIVIVIVIVLLILILTINNKYFFKVSQSDKLVSLDNPVYEVPVDERPPSPAYVEPDQLAMSDPKDAAKNLDYLEVVIW